MGAAKTLRSLTPLTQKEPPMPIDMSTRPNVAEILSAAQAKQAREATSAAGRRAKAQALDGAAQVDDADANAGKVGEMLVTQAGKCFTMSDEMGDAEQFAPFRERIETLGREMAVQAQGLSQPNDQPDPAT